MFGSSSADADENRPLKGDENGVFRVHIIGNSGAGKVRVLFILGPFETLDAPPGLPQSTLADTLGAILRVPVVHLDEVFWKPDWAETPAAEFQARVATILGADECKRGWVIDGNYMRRLGGQLDSVSDVIWLDPPLLLYFPRLVWRTLLRLLGLRAPCARGCPERAQETFSPRNSILVFALTHHASVRRGGYRRLREDGERTRRIGGWGGELGRWVEEVKAMVRAR